MKCITSVKFSINLNGQQGPLFKGQRGMKQGDPLSPLLFVITMEYLSRLFQKASKQTGFEFHPHCKRVGLTHCSLQTASSSSTKLNHPPCKHWFMHLLCSLDVLGLKLTWTNHILFLERSVLTFNKSAWILQDSQRDIFPLNI